MPPQNEGEGMAQLLERWLDWPPLWTLAGIAVVAVLGWVGFPWGFGAYGPGLALACLIVGLWLMGMAAWRMLRSRTTVNPRGTPAVLVTDGVFAISRNPIYLGDLFLLLAASFWWDSIPGLAVAAGFVPLATQRFILGEEEKLGEVFGDAAAEWFLRVRRWI